MKRTLTIITILFISIVSYSQLKPHIITTGTTYDFQFSGETVFQINDEGKLTKFINSVSKIHRIADYDVTSTDWDTLVYDTIIESETVGAWSLGTDSSYIIPSDTGIYSFCGCFHLKNNKGNALKANFLSYIVNNNTDTATCSQISTTIAKDDGEYVTITFCGTIVAGITSRIQVLFKISDVGLDFEHNPDLPRPVSASINFRKISN